MFKKTIVVVVNVTALSSGNLFAQSPESLIDLRFDTSNAGDVANHPRISNIAAWTNGSELAPDPFESGVNYLPDNDFGNGYAGLTTPSPRFGWKWGFEGGFDSLGQWDVTLVSFDYDVLGHNGEALLELTVGGWSGSAPLPSTGASSFGPAFTEPAIGERSTGTVTFDFAGDLLTVSRAGYASYTTPFTDVFTLNSGTSAIDILVSNLNPSSDGYWDANADSTAGQDALYRIDNFVIVAQAIPEASTAFLALASGGLFLLRRRRS